MFAKARLANITIPELEQSRAAVLNTLCSKSRTRPSASARLQRCPETIALVSHMPQLQHAIMPAERVAFARRDTEFRLIERLCLVRWRSWRGRIYVEEQAHGGADHYCAEAGRLLLRKR